MSLSILPYQTFEKIYARSGRPLVVRNATKNWRAMEEFSFNFFSNLYKNLSSPVLTGEEGCQFFAWDFSEFRNLGEVFAMDADRAEMKGNYTPWYVGWSNCDQESEAELAQYFSLPTFFHPATIFGTKTWFFIGTPGYGAPSHIDQVALPSWQAQVAGEDME